MIDWPSNQGEGQEAFYQWTLMSTGVAQGCPLGVKVSLGATDRLRCLHQQRSPARKGPRVSEIGSATI